MTKIRTGHIVAGLVGAGVSAVLTSRPTAARISDSENQVKQIEARYDLKKAQLQTAIATTNDRNEEIRHLNELIATYESQVNELTSALEITEDAMLRMFDDFKNKTQELEERSSKLESANAQAQKNAEHATKLVAQYQQELSAARDKITLLESKVSTLNQVSSELDQVSNELSEINAHHKGRHHPEEYGMSQWFVDHMTGRGAHEIIDGKKVVVLDNDKFEVPVGITKSYGFKTYNRVTSPSAYTDAMIRAHVPNWRNHGHPEFTGDWVRRKGNTFYRPTHANDWR